MSASEEYIFAILSPEIEIDIEKNKIKWIPIQELNSRKNTDIYKQYIQDVLQGFEPPNADFEVWSFGNNERLANELAELVIAKRKTGTSSSLWGYEYYQEEIPKVGEVSIITNWTGIPKCIIETTKVEIVKYNEVTEAFAKTEGEGDLSLTYWKKAHWDFFYKGS